MHSVNSPFLAGLKSKVKKIKFNFKLYALGIMHSENSPFLAGLKSKVKKIKFKV